MCSATIFPMLFMRSAMQAAALILLCLVCLRLTRRKARASLLGIPHLCICFCESALQVQ